MLPIRSALGRVLARDIVSPINVPAHDNSAMDGYALRGSDLAAGRRHRAHVDRHRLRRPAVRRRRAGRPVRAHHDRRGDAGRPRHRRAAGVRQDRRRAGARAGRRRAHRRQPPPRRRRPAPAATPPCAPAACCARPTWACWPRSARPRCRCCGACASPSFPPATSCVRSASRSTQGCVYDSNRYTLWGMLQRLGVEVLDLGVVRDDPVALDADLPSTPRRMPTP